MKSSVKDIKLTSYDDIFKTDEEKQDAAQEKVQEIPLSDLFPFENHPFQVRDDDSMKDTAESIRKYGVLVPAIARPRPEGGYELIAGHRRKHACELAGKETMPVIIRKLDDDAATIIMVDSNLQRENILPSERALAYRMKLEALKHQGQRTDLTSVQVEQKLKGSSARDIVAKEAGESGPQVFRYIRLTELSPELLQMVDDKKVAFNPAVELSYLKPEEQTLLLDEIEKQQAILMSLENNDLTDDQASALLKSPSPLGDIFAEFESRETGYMDTVLDCITDKANAVIQMEAAERQALLNTPVYKYPAAYAREHGEIEPYRASHKANIACRDAIDDAIRDNYRNNCLGSDTAKQVIAEFGFDRTLYVLANTVREKDWDGRIDRKNKDWARTISVFDDENGFGDNRNREFIVDRAHPGLVDLFINQARREYLLTQPLTKEDIQAEAARLLRRLQSEREPNSPGGKHFMVQISPDFLTRASTKDQNRLFALLPFKSLSFSTLKDRNGIFAFIQKDENRNQPLRQRNPSVRDKLQKTQAAPKLSAPSKDKGMER